MLLFAAEITCLLFTAEISLFQAEISLFAEEIRVDFCYKRRSIRSTFNANQLFTFNH